MHKINIWLVGFLVFIGVGVGIMSLYMASLSGVMSKMGLVGGDFQQSINTNELARQLRSRGEEVNCSSWQVAKKVPLYLLSKGEERVRLAGELGGERIICGIRHVQDGNVERGVYTLVKGLYYLKSQYAQMKLLVQGDRAACELLGKTEYGSWVEGYLRATEGRVYELVLEVYKQVERERSGVEELCLD